jgi:sec-independent protein translocase protein TatA
MGFDSMSAGSVLLILLITVLLFGTRKLQRMGGDLGNAVRGFCETMHEGGVRRVESMETELLGAIASRESGTSESGSVAQTSEKPASGARAAGKNWGRMGLR